MGLAAYGDIKSEETENFTQIIEEKLIQIKSDGSYELNAQKSLTYSTFFIRKQFMPALLKNIEFQKTLDTQGYIKLSFLDKDELKELISFYNNQKIINNTPCFASNTILTIEQNKIISDKILSIIHEKTTNLFTNFVFHGGTFLIKTLENGELSLHQDNSIVDESSDNAYYLWIPIQDVNQNNGCMFVLPGSHLYFQNYVSYSLKNPDIFRKLIPEENIEDIIMKGGELLVFSSKLFHGSYSNTSKKKRVAVNILITNKDAKLVYYHKKNDSVISKYIVDPVDYLNSYSSYSKGELPTNATFEKEINYTHKVINHETLYYKLTNKKYPKLLEIGFKISQLISKTFR